MVAFHLLYPSALSLSLINTLVEVILCKFIQEIGELGQSVFIPSYSNFFYLSIENHIAQCSLLKLFIIVILNSKRHVQREELKKKFCSFSRLELNPRPPRALKY